MLSPKLGTYSNDGILCYQCEQGQVSGIAASSCTTCPPGSITIGKGSNKCIYCTAGKYQNEYHTECLYCPSGKVSSNGAESINQCISAC